MKLLVMYSLRPLSFAEAQATQPVGMRVDCPSATCLYCKLLVERVSTKLGHTYQIFGETLHRKRGARTFDCLQTFQRVVAKLKRVSEFFCILSDRSYLQRN